jgi:hypothetical protein
VILIHCNKSCAGFSNRNQAIEKTLQEFSTGMTESSTSIICIPNEILYKIFQYLTIPKDLVAAASVNQQWKAIGNENGLWKSKLDFDLMNVFIRID